MPDESSWFMNIDSLVAEAMAAKESPEPEGIREETRQGKKTTSPSYSPPPQSPKSGSVTPKAGLGAQAKPEQLHSTTLSSPSPSPELQSNARRPMQNCREKAKYIQAKANEASTDDSKSSNKRSPMADVDVDGDTIMASPRPALYRSTDSLGKRHLCDNDNPGYESPCKKRPLSGIKVDDEKSSKGDNEKMSVANLLLSINPDLSRRRLKCTNCECWDWYCSLENNTYAPSPCTTCEKKQQYCLEGHQSAANWYQRQRMLKEGGNPDDNEDQGGHDSAADNEDQGGQDSVADSEKCVQM
jgi:hypothetical protein